LELPTPQSVNSIRDAVVARVADVAVDSLLFVRNGVVLQPSSTESSDATPVVVVVMMSAKRSSPVLISTGLLLSEQTPFQPNGVDIVANEVPNDALSMMVDHLGFDATRAKKALQMTRGQLENAIEWLAEHQEDADIDAPLTDQQLLLLGAASLVPRVPRVEQPASVRTCLELGLCTFCVTGRQFTVQSYYRCLTCSFGQNEGVCESCARLCHRGHSLGEKVFTPSFYCDCAGTGDKCVANGEFK